MTHRIRFALLFVVSLLLAGVLFNPLPHVEALNSTAPKVLEVDPIVVTTEREPKSTPEVPPLDTEHAAALDLARVCWNESPHALDESRLRHGSECAAIWATARGNARSDDIERVHSWLRRLSPRVTGTVPLDDDDVNRNVAWTSGLTWSNVAPPMWPAGLKWGRYFERWISFRDHNLQVVRGQILSACEATLPRAWGSPRLDADVFEARNAARLERGRRPFEVIQCGNTANFYAGLVAAAR